MAELLMIITSGLLIMTLAIFGIAICVKMCVGIYEVLTGKYKTQYDKVLERLNKNGI